MARLYDYSLDAGSKVVQGMHYATSGVLGYIIVENEPNDIAMYSLPTHEDIEKICDKHRIKSQKVFSIIDAMPPDTSLLIFQIHQLPDDWFYDD